MIWGCYRCLSIVYLFRPFLYISVLPPSFWMSETFEFETLDWLFTRHSWKTHLIAYLCFKPSQPPHDPMLWHQSWPSLAFSRTCTSFQRPVSLESLFDFVLCNARTHRSSPFFSFGFSHTLFVECILFIMQLSSFLYCDRILYYDFSLVIMNAFNYG